MKFRTAVKKSIQSVCASDDPAFVIGSMGRSGSTVIYESIADALQAKRFTRLFGEMGSRLVRDQSWSLGEKPLYRGVVYKTHDYPEKLSGLESVKAVFLFGSAVDACLSVYSCLERFGQDWVDEHFNHLKSDKNFEQLLETDALYFEEQMRRWTSIEDAPVLCMRYESLWEHENDLADFCNLPVRLPEKRPRIEKSYPKHITEKAKQVYGKIDDKFASLPDCFIAGRPWSNSH